MLENFKADKMIAWGEVEVDVTRFNGMMAICGDDEGCVLITKEQAMKFFGLTDNQGDSK